jgi:hypothetical protein
MQLMKLKMTFWTLKYLNLPKAFMVSLILEFQTYVIKWEIGKNEIILSFFLAKIDASKVNDAIMKRKSARGAIKHNGIPYR